MANVAAPDLAPILDLPVLKERVPYYFLNYFWIPILASFTLQVAAWAEMLKVFPADNLALLIQFFLFSFYPLFLALGFTIKALLRRIPDTFQKLVETGALPGAILPQVAREMQTGIIGFLPRALGIVGACAAFAMDLTLVPPAAILAGQVSGTNLALLVLDVSWGYVYGIATGITFSAVWSIYQLSRQGNLVVRPFHPDGCSGLGAIGQFFLSLALVFTVVCVYLAGWILFANLPGSKNMGFFIEYFQAFFVGFLVLFLLLGLGAFYLLVYAVHERMEEQSSALQASLPALGIRLAELEEACVRKSDQQSPEQLKADHEQIELLRSTYASRRDLPTWPINWESMKGFLIKIPVVVTYVTGAMKGWEQLRPHGS